MSKCLFHYKVDGEILQVKDILPFHHLTPITEEVESYGISLEFTKATPEFKSLFCFRKQVHADRFANYLADFVSEDELDREFLDTALKGMKINQIYP